MTAVPGPSSTPKQAATTPKVVQFGFTKYHSLRRQEKPATTTVLAPLSLINKDNSLPLKTMMMDQNRDD